MNRYNIKKAVRTPVQVFKNLVTSANYALTPVADLPGCGFLITADVEASSWKEAYGLFLKGIIPIINAGSVITQCAIHSFVSSSHLIYKRNDNPDHVFFFYYAAPTSAVGMMLHDAELADIERILGSDLYEQDAVAISYLRQSNTATGPVFWLSTLLMAAEAFAGTEDVERVCTSCSHVSSYAATNKEALQEMLGSGLYDELYRKGRVRHKLVHGGRVDEAEVARIGEQVYERLILHYLVERYGLKSLREIVNPPRSESIERFATWTTCESEPELSQVVKKREELPYVVEPNGY